MILSTGSEKGFTKLTPECDADLVNIGIIFSKMRKYAIRYDISKEVNNTPNRVLYVTVETTDLIDLLL